MYKLNIVQNVIPTRSYVKICVLWIMEQEGSYLILSQYSEIGPLEKKKTKKNS